MSQVYKETRQRLHIAANRRAKHHNAKVKGDNLRPGQLVFCRDHSHRGRHKIKNHLSSVLYKVVCCPQDEGPIYTIVTADGKGHPKQIHRTEIRPAPCFLSNTEEIPDPGLPSDLLNEYDNYVSEIPFVLELVEQVLQNHTPGVANLAPLPTGEVDTELHGDETMPSTEMEGPRCSQRATAGQHRNLHHLPRSVMQHSQQVHINAPYVTFHRPWL